MKLPGFDQAPAKPGTCRPLAFAAAGLAAGLTLASAPSSAAERPSDAETDHVDAYDDGGKPSVGIFADPGALLLGAWGGELELALGDAAALSLEVDGLGLAGVKAYGASLGMPLFVERVRFHGMYIQPRLAAERSSGGGVSASSLGLGATAGWEETWRFGLSLKGGVGILYETTVQGDAPNVLVLGIRPLVDAAVGWVF
jgi:hypothetical protein